MVQFQRREWGLCGTDPDNMLNPVIRDATDTKSAQENTSVWYEIYGLEQVSLRGSMFPIQTSSNWRRGVGKSFLKAPAVTEVSARCRSTWGPTSGAGFGFELIPRREITSFGNVFS